MPMEILYILGSTRSGTSALRNAVANTRFKGYGEGHLAPILRDILSTIRDQKMDGLGAEVKGNGLHALKPDVLLRHLFHGYERYLVKQFESDSIVDKTPTVTPIQMAPDLNRYHARPKFLYCGRRHVDNVLSKTRKFPEQTLEQHCREWAGCNKAWLDVRGQLDDVLEIEYHDMVHRPDETAEAIADFLLLSTQDASHLTEALVHGRPEHKPGRALTDFKTLAEAGWSEEEQSVVRDLCGPVGDLYGYAFDDYFVGDRPLWRSHLADA